MVICGDLPDENASILLGERLAKALNVDLDLDHGKVHVTGSIGMTLSHSSRDDPEELLRAADSAMYRAKSLGRGRLERFDSQQPEYAGHYLHIEGAIRDALDGDHLRLEYQPISDLRTGRVSCAEALVRIQDPRLGLLMPDQFIATADKTRLIIPVGHWVLQEACRQLRQWHMQVEQLGMSINISGFQMRDPILHAVVADAISSFDLDPRQLSLEMAESVLLDPTDDFLANFNALASSGLQLAIDNFGQEAPA